MRALNWVLGESKIGVVARRINSKIFSSYKFITNRLGRVQVHAMCVTVVCLSGRMIRSSVQGHSHNANVVLVSEISCGGYATWETHTPHTRSLSNAEVRNGSRTNCALLTRHYTQNTRREWINN